MVSNGRWILTTTWRMVHRAAIPIVHRCRKCQSPLSPLDPSHDTSTMGHRLRKVRLDTIRHQTPPKMNYHATGCNLDWERTSYWSSA